MHKRSSNVAAVMALLALWMVPSVALAEGQAEGAADQPMEITWQLRETTSHAAQVAEEIFNVRILGNGIWNNDAEKIDLMFASGETPEVFSAGDDQFHYRDGLTREIPLAMIQEHAPLHYQWMLDHPIALNISRSPDSEDAYFSLIGVAMFSAAYMAEVVRGGLQAIPKGQYEAAQALGLSYPKMMAFIVLPQALKLVIPGIVNTFIGLFKDTTLVLIIGLFDLLGVVQLAATNPDWLGFAVEGYAVAAVGFWVFCFAMSRYSMYLERKLETGHKR